MVEVERDAAGYTKGQIRALKIAIAIMTFAIVAGLVVMVVTIAYRAANHKGVAAPASGATVSLGTLFPASGTYAQAQLPPGAHIVAVTPWGERLVLTVEDYGGTSVLVLDPKTAKIEPLARLGNGG